MKTKEEILSEEFLTKIEKLDNGCWIIIGEDNRIYVAEKTKTLITNWNHVFGN